MGKAWFLSLLVVGFVSVAAIPQTHAAPVCTTVSKTTAAGTFTGDICIDPTSGSIAISGTATLSNGQEVTVDATGSISLTLTNGKPTYTIQAHLTVTEGGTTILSEDLTITGTTFNLAVTKFTTTVVNLSL